MEGNGNATTTSLIHTDHLNSVALTSDKNGNLSELSAYYPYGAHRLTDLPSSGMNVKRGYIGQYEDTATELSYLNARYYDGGRGQFLTIDPVFLRDPNRQNLANPQSFNSYAYANGNPANLSDPGGEAGGPPARQSFSSFNAWASASLSWAQSTLTSMQASVTQSAKSTGSAVAGGYREYSEGLKQGVFHPIDSAKNIATGNTSSGANTAGQVVGISAATIMTVGPLALTGGGAAEPVVITSAVGADSKKIFGARTLYRMGEDVGPNHNFPTSIMDDVFLNGNRTVSPNFWKTPKPGMSDTGVMYRLPGEINGEKGFFEIATRPSNSGKIEVITHYFFRPTNW